jgi:hypothetical protein
MGFAIPVGAGERRPARRWAAAGLALAILGAGPAAADECAPWSGEPDPLPTLEDPDPLRARWAALRAVELSERAKSLEQAATIEAYLLWQRVLCLRPGSLEARLGTARSRPIRIYRPAVVLHDTGSKPESLPTDDPWNILAEPIAVALPEVAPVPFDRTAARRRLLAAVDAELVDGELRLWQARFEAALEAAVRARRRLDRMRSGADLRQRRVRLELLSATAQLALGDEQAARESLVRAIESQPDLVLDPAKTSPKVIRALESARTAAERSR